MFGGERQSNLRVTPKRFAALLGVLVAAVVIYLRAAPRMNDGFGAFAVALAIPALVAAGAWLVREGVRQRRDLRVLAAGAKPRDGEWVAISGTARAVREPYEQTLSGQSALVSSYRVVEKVPGMRRGGAASSYSLHPRYAGWHMVPTVIETDTARVQLRGFPDLFGLEPSPHGASNVHRLEARAAPPPGPFRLASEAGLLVEPRDELHVDWLLGEARPDGQIETKEWVLRANETVCICGWYEGGALLPDASRPDGLPLYLGSAEQVLAKLRGESRLYVRSGAVALAISVILAAWFLL